MRSPKIENLRGRGYPGIWNSSPGIAGEKWMLHFCMLCNIMLVIFTHKITYICFWWKRLMFQHLKLVKILKKKYFKLAKIWLIIRRYNLYFFMIFQMSKMAKIMAYSESHKSKLAYSFHHLLIFANLFLFLSKIMVKNGTFSPGIPGKISPGTGILKTSGPRGSPGTESPGSHPSSFQF